MCLHGSRLESRNRYQKILLFIAKNYSRAFFVGRVSLEKTKRCFRNLVTLLEQASTLGRVEHELTKYSCGIWKPMMNGDLHSTKSSFNISVFVEIILNPENIALQRLTPSIFKVEFLWKDHSGFRKQESSCKKVWKRWTTRENRCRIITNWLWFWRKFNWLRNWWRWLASRF